MKVFIENVAGSNQKNLYNVKTLEYKKTVTVSREYPYPYGFILDTTSGDGDNLDCFVLTDTKLEAGKIYECEPVGLMEQRESAWSPEGKNVMEEDHNVLACLVGEQAEVTEEVKVKLTEFVSHVFDHLEGKVVNVGSFLEKEAAEQIIKETQD
jgi:inorganic pyrophosphatase